MSGLELQLKELVLVRELLQERGTDVTELEREIDRLRSLKGRSDLPAAA